MWWNHIEWSFAIFLTGDSHVFFFLNCYFHRLRVFKLLSATAISGSGWVNWLDRQIKYLSYISGFDLSRFGLIPQQLLTTQIPPVLLQKNQFFRSISEEHWGNLTCLRIGYLPWLLVFCEFVVMAKTSDLIWFVCSQLLPWPSIIVVVKVGNQQKLRKEGRRNRKVGNQQIVCDASNCFIICSIQAFPKIAGKEQSIESGKAHP